MSTPDAPKKMLAGEYTASPEDTTRSTLPIPYVPPPPETRNPPLCVLNAAVVMLETLNALLVVSVGCLLLNAVATSPSPVIVTLAAATEATLKALLVVKVFCLVPTAAEISVITSVPPT